ncbi:class A beta-lactamase-related serine hydrolase [Lacticaseibacillus parakribbianus]|uniref:class A beta-lactamase-related serine hydrolase n=1 Tax=Lacticaseibacillus parakribbianus TaxID=2970927 RepID=UPI0021CAF379|nr:class A beta-lactamase-related serine hydrolase [Lacticaseibacillus parakribbianus]
MSKHHHHRRLRWDRVAMAAGCTVLVLSLLGWGVHTMVAPDDGLDEPATAAKAETDASAETTGSSAASTSAAKTATVKKAAATTALTAAQVTQRQQSIRTKLAAYLKEVGASGNVAVSFYNLSPTADSAAAKARTAAVYQQGALAASVNGTTSWTAASTYKLYITAYLFHQVESGARTWTSEDETGFTNMIVNSANEYGEAQLYRYGATAMNAYFASLGIVSPVFGNGIAKTTANDLVTMLRRIALRQAPFANASLASKLTGDMATQVYRDGIPAAVASLTPKAVVQDKVGWLESTDNDAAIVTLPNGQRYLLAVLTTNQDYMDWSLVQTVATRVQQIVYGD